MSRRIGNPVHSCPSAAGATSVPAAPAAAAVGSTGKPGETAPGRARHPDCAIKILSIGEENNDASPEFKDGAEEIFVKGLIRRLVIRYQISGLPMSVTLYAAYDSGNKVNADFYSGYEDNGVTGPIVAVIVAAEPKDPGIYEAFWDCRDATPDHRILLAGTYKLKILGLDDLVHRDSTTIKIKPPRAFNYGIHYGIESSKTQVLGARDAQKSLLDGTTLQSEASFTELAVNAWSALRSAAVMYVCSHSNPALFALYPEEDQPGKPVVFKKEKQTVVTTWPIDPSHLYIDMGNSVEVMKQPSDALRDVFLVILGGCRAGNEVMLLQRRLQDLSKKFNPGKIDGQHGPKTTAALQAWQEWENIEPADGQVNDDTLAAMSIDPSLFGSKQTTEIQKKLKSFSTRYDPGGDSGLYTPQTQAAVTHYQEDHSPPLEVTSLPDSDTLTHLRFHGATTNARNIAETFVARGCNIALGFKNKVSFDGAHQFGVHFWDLASQGTGIEDAAIGARLLAGVLYARELEYHLYTRDGVDRNSTLHPARHGKDI